MFFPFFPKDLGVRLEEFKSLRFWQFLLLSTKERGKGHCFKHPYLAGPRYFFHSKDIGPGTVRAETITESILERVVQYILRLVYWN